MNDNGSFATQKENEEERNRGGGVKRRRELGLQSKTEMGEMGREIIKRKWEMGRLGGWKVK